MCICIYNLYIRITITLCAPPRRLPKQNGAAAFSGDIPLHLLSKYKLFSAFPVVIIFVRFDQMKTSAPLLVYTVVIRNECLGRTFAN